MKRRDLAVAVIILENSDVRQSELRDLAAKMKPLGAESCGKKTKDCPWHTDRKPEPRPPTVNATVNVS